LKTIIALIVVPVVVCFGLLLSSGGCGAPLVVPTIKLDVEAVICITSELEQDITDPLVIMKDCPSISQAFFADVQLFVSSFLKGKAAAKAKQAAAPAAPDAGTK